MKKANYFPLGVAKEEAFCNRVVEREQLINNIEQGKHTLIISPRRYGKSSLVLYCLDEFKLHYDRVDLFVAINAKTIEEQILKGVKNLIAKVSSVPEQAVGFIKQYLKNLKSKWVIGTDGVNIELIPEKESDPANTILEALQMLETVLKKKKVKAVFFIDEFQEIGVLANSSGIEGAIRHVAQECEYLHFIFSGSNRHILANMFDDRSSPLYMLCDRIVLNRISEQDYITHLGRIIDKTTKKPLQEAVISEIFKLTERHPYYMNALCDKLKIGYTADVLIAEEVKERWDDYVLQEESRTARDLSPLNILQKKILIAVSQGAFAELTGKAALHKFGVTSAAVVKSLSLLEEQDYINKNKQGEYSVVDPLIKASLRVFYPAIQ